MRLRLCKIENAYFGYLNKRLPNLGLKEQRPFAGVVLSIDNVDYYAPLHKVRNKHYIHMGDDCFKIYGRKKIKNPALPTNELVQEIKGVINLNLMLPIPKGQVYEIDFSTVDEKMKELYNEEISFLNRKKNSLIEKAQEVLDNYNTKKNIKLFERCYNFPELVKLCKDFK